MVAAIKTFALYVQKSQLVTSWVTYVGLVDLRRCESHCKVAGACTVNVSFNVNVISY